jgi:serine/threonine-protein kinase
VRFCPACSREYGEEFDVCKDDGVGLVHLDVSAAQNAQDLIGQLVDGRYRVERIVGRGGMGTIYACRHVVVGKTFAMKVLRAGIERSEEILQRFIREAQAANAIKSRHICEMSDFGQLQNGAFYVVMELLDGMSLTRALRERHLVRRDIKHVFIQIAETLQKAHDQQIIHRDLKPDNVVLVVDEDDPFFVKLVDFGIAKVMQSKASNLTETGVILGTPYYMSPEQARGDPIDHRSDIYALGVMMYRAFTGRLPFVADTAMGVLTRHLTQKPQLPSLITEIDTAAERLILRCLEKVPIDRFQSMSDVALALESLPDELGERVRATVDERTPRYGERPRQATPTQVATPAAIAAASAPPTSEPPPSSMPVIPGPMPAPFAPRDLVFVAPAREPVVGVATPAGGTPSGFASNAVELPGTGPSPGAYGPQASPPLKPFPNPSPTHPMPWTALGPATAAPAPIGHGAHGKTGVQPGSHLDFLPPHLQGESNTSRGVVSSRLSARPNPGRRRVGMWLALCAIAFASVGVTAVVLRSQLVTTGSASVAPVPRANGDDDERAPVRPLPPSEPSATSALATSPPTSASSTTPSATVAVRASGSPPLQSARPTASPANGWAPPPPPRGDEIRSPFD